MTLFNRISEDERPRISVHSGTVINTVSDMIYGGFTEHMGRCIYGGLYDPGNPLSDENGFRKDVIEALKEINVPIVRYPGGNFCATYHWMDGIGPRNERPARQELAWENVESNQFGTDEFLHWCEVVGTEPYLCLNIGTGTLDEALAWVEYCNSDKASYYANLRRRNGREKPYNVKYWSLGNEVHGHWQVAQMTKEDYVKKAFQWAKALKMLDPSIKLIIAGEVGSTSWDQYVAAEGFRAIRPDVVPGEKSTVIDLFSIHIYTSRDEHLQNATSPLHAERQIEICAALIDAANFENGCCTPNQRICFDEWNVWNVTRAPGNLGAEEKYTLSDAIAMGVWLNVLVRQSKHLAMANLAQSVNVISPLMTTGHGIWKQTTWWPLLMYSKYMRGDHVLTVHHGAEWQGETFPRWLRGVANTPWLDISAVLDKDDFINLAVVNIHETKDVETEIGNLLGGKRIETFTVHGKDATAVNTAEKTEVSLDRGEVQVGEDGVYLFPHLSVTLLRWKS